LIYYIHIIESFLNDYEKYEDEYIIGLNDSLTFLYYSLAKYEKALDIQDRMLELRERLFGKETNKYAVGLNLKAVILNELVKYNEAVDIHKKLISIRENKENLNIDLAINWNNIFIVYEKLGKYNLSLNYAIKALKINEEILDKNHPELARTYLNIGCIYKDLKEYMEKAKNIYGLYGYKKSELHKSIQFIKEIEDNIKREENLKNYKKRGKYCKDLEKEN
jgi:tetratricopeptide (TPR) repeat protein